jgi:hypothetical protein
LAGHTTRAKEQPREASTAFSPEKKNESLFKKRTKLRTGQKDEKAD